MREIYGSQVDPKTDADDDEWQEQSISEGVGNVKTMPWACYQTRLIELAPARVSVFSAHSELRGIP